MGLLLESTFTEVIYILLFIYWILHLYITQKYDYWKKRGVPCVQPAFPFGTQQDLVYGRLQTGEIFQKFYMKFENAPYFGVYETRKPVLVVKDPELIKRILTKDFHHFTNRFEFTIDKKTQYITWHLFNMTGQEWKRMRLKLTPTFTSGKMKLMFFLMLKCSQQLRDYIEKQIKTNPEVNVKDVLARFTMDIIATCAFGLEINSLTEEDSEFYQVGINIFKTSKLTIVRRILYGLFPLLNKVVPQRFLPLYIIQVFTKIVRETAKYRVDNNVNRNDFLDLLIRVRQKTSLLDDEPSCDSEIDKKTITNDAELSIEEITAQCFIFFFAGFETASSTMTFCLFELSQNLDIQERLYQEVKEVLAKHGGEPTYQALQEMTYMDQVINETLRRYASLPSLDRTCTETYTLPDSNLVLEKGQRITIPIYAIHHDPDYYPDPYKFDPERFSTEKMKERHSYVHLPFGEGPRMCIGMRFGLMQTKIGLTEMISKFHFKLSPNTQIPVSLNKRSFLTVPEKQILLHVSIREVDS